MLFLSRILFLRGGSAQWFGENIFEAMNNIFLCYFDENNI